jgi:hypothetical protein
VLSLEEAGNYLSTFKQFEHRPPDMIRERVDKDHSSILRNALTSISKVNKTDVETLRTTFGVRGHPLVARVATPLTGRLAYRALRRSRPQAVTVSHPCPDLVPSRSAGLRRLSNTRFVPRHQPRSTQSPHHPLRPRLLVRVRARTIARTRRGPRRHARKVRLGTSRVPVFNRHV